jgi:hypothetical protein
VSRGLTDKRSKGANFSQIDSAVSLIKDTAVVTSAGSFAGYERGLMTYNGNRYLNIHNRDVLQPAPEPTVWGSTGKFPFISHFYDEFFSSPEQLPFMLSWGSRFYRSFQRRVPQSGQALLIFGRPGRGKTFHSEALWSILMGGSAEAKEWLNGEDIFNSELFDYCFWRIDDGSLSANYRTAGVYAEMLKRVTANKSFRSNEKYRKAGQVQWQGRIAITGNDDAESLRSIPNMDISMQEKVMLFRVAADRMDGFKFRDDVEMRVILAQEIPHFARFLMDFKIPDHCTDAETRYGVKAYHEPSLRNAANHSSVSATFGEILDEALREFFTVRDTEADCWTGTSLQLHKMILQDGSLTEAMRPYNVQTVARNLSTLSAKKVFNIEVLGDEHRRFYRIHRDDRFPQNKKVSAILHSDKFSRQ